MEGKQSLIFDFPEEYNNNIMSAIAEDMTIEEYKKTNNIDTQLFVLYHSFNLGIFDKLIISIDSRKK